MHQNVLISRLSKIFYASAEIEGQESNCIIICIYYESKQKLITTTSDYYL